MYSLKLCLARSVMRMSDYVTRVVVLAHTVLVDLIQSSPKSMRSVEDTNSETALAPTVQCVQPIYYDSSLYDH